MLNEFYKFKVFWAVINILCQLWLQKLSSLNDTLFLLLMIGLTVQDFGKESQGEMIIEFLQMRHKCVITVRDAATADMRYSTLLIWLRCVFIRLKQ